MHVVYPATDTASVSGLKLEGRENLIISIAQFRPEKDHALQMRAFALFRSNNPEIKAQLVMIGSVRNAGDQAIVDGIRALGNELRLKEDEDYVLATNVPYSTLLKLGICLVVAALFLRTQKKKDTMVGRKLVCIQCGTSTLALGWSSCWLREC